VSLNFARSARLAFALALTVAAVAISAGPAAANSNYVYVPTQYAGPGANFLGAYEGPYDQNEGEGWQHTVCINEVHYIGGIGNEWRVNSPCTNGPGVVLDNVYNQGSFSGQLFNQAYWGNTVWAWESWG
jgi:hypothetical protein